MDSGKKAYFLIGIPTKGDAVFLASEFEVTDPVATAAVKTWSYLNSMYSISTLATSPTGLKLIAWLSVDTL